MSTPEYTYFERDPRLSPNQLAFLSAYVHCGNVSQAAKCAGVSRMRHYDWVKNSEAYKTVFASAHETACDLLEAEARRRAIEGNRSYKFHQGAPIPNPNYRPGVDDPSEQYYYESSYSDSLLQTLLKAHRPDKFKERVSQEHSGPDGSPISFNGNTDEAREVIASLTDRFKGASSGSVHGELDGSSDEVDPEATGSGD